MTQENYFDNISESPIFRDKSPLDPEITPERDKIVCRDKQIKQLASHLTDMVQYGTAKNLLITGDTGVGKTATTKVILSDLERKLADQNFRNLYMTDMKNERNVLRKISKKLDLNFRGQSNLEEYYDRLEDKLIEKDMKVALVLDEVDKLFEKSTQKDHGNSLFKRLLEVRNKVNSSAGGYLLIIGITNNVDTPGYFSPRVDSRFGRETIHFPSYNGNELKKILKARAEEAMKPKTLDQGALSKAAAIVAKKDGDARKAIILLRKAGEIAEDAGETQILKKHLDRAERMLEEERIMDSIKECSSHSQLVLYAALDLKNKPSVSTGDLYSKYQKFAKRNQSSPLTQRRVRDLIDKLDMMGLITAEIKSRGRGKGRTRQISINFGDDTMETIESYLEDKFGDLTK